MRSGQGRGVAHRCRAGRRLTSPLPPPPISGFVPSEQHNPDYRTAPPEPSHSSHTCLGGLRDPGTIRDPGGGRPWPEDAGPMRLCSPVAAAGGLLPQDTHTWMARSRRRSLRGPAPPPHPPRRHRPPRADSETEGTVLSRWGRYCPLRHASLPARGRSLAHQPAQWLGVIGRGPPS